MTSFCLYDSSNSRGVHLKAGYLAISAKVLVSQDNGRIRRYLYLSSTGRTPQAACLTLVVSTGTGMTTGSTRMVDPKISDFAPTVFLGIGYFASRLYDRAALVSIKFSLGCCKNVDRERSQSWP